MQHPTRASRRTGDRGVALVLSLLVLSVLIVLVIQFTYSAKIEERLVGNFLADDRAYYAALGGVAWAKAVLRDDQSQTEVDSIREDWARAETAFETDATVGDIPVIVSLVDTERRIDVNLLHDEKKAELIKTFLTALATKIETEEENVAERLIDFVDPDEEGDYEEGALNRRLLDISELEQIPEIEPETLHGRFDEETGERIPGLLDFLTILSAGKININTASAEVLFAILPEKDKDDKPIDRDAAVEAIVQFRGDPEPAKPGEEPGELPDGNEFAEVSELASSIPQLKQLFEPSEGGGQGGGEGGSGSGSGEGEEATVSLDKVLSVTSYHFRVSIEARSPVVFKRAAATIRRHGDAMEVIAWREIPE